MLSVFLLIAAVLAVFGRVGGHEFLMYDDEPHLVDNPRLNPVTWRNVGRFWVEPSYWGLYIPLSYTFFAAEASLAGQPLDPTVFHLGSLVLHVACVLLVFAILRRLVRHDGAACAAALLFGLHPVQVESVAWISETRGLLCGMFSLLAIWQLGIWDFGFGISDLGIPGPSTLNPQPQIPNPKSQIPNPKSRAPQYVLATLAFVLALLSKPAAVAVPLVAAVLAVGFRISDFRFRIWHLKLSLEGPKIPKSQILNPKSEIRNAAATRRILRGLGPWLLLAAGWAVLTKLQQPSGRMAFVPPVWARPLIAGDALAYYLYELVGPLWYVLALTWHALLAPWRGLEPLVSWARPHLYGPDYGRAPAWVIGQWWFYFSWLVPACLLATFAWWLVRVEGGRGKGEGGSEVRMQNAECRIRQSPTSNPQSPSPESHFSIQHSAFSISLTAAGVFVAWLLPVLGLLPFDFQRISTVADRYLYLALLAPALVLGWFLARHWNRLTITLTAAGLTLLGVLSFLQVSYWHDNDRLIEHSLRVNPRSALAMQHRGALLNREGDLLSGEGKPKESTKKHEQAIAWYRQVLKEHPQQEETYLNLANTLLTLGRVEEAEETLREALRQVSMWPPVHCKLADVLVQRGKTLLKQRKTNEAQQRFDEAQRQYREAYRLDPDWALPYRALGRLRFDRGATEEAIGLYRKALDVDPNDAEARVELAVALEKLGKIAEALGDYRAALQIRPDCPRANFNLGNLLMAQGQVEAAIWHYQAELEFYPKYAPAHVNLGIALSQQLKIPEAIRHYQVALQIDPDLAEAHLHLGHALTAQNRHQEAAAEYRAALQLVPPDSKEAEQIRGVLKLQEEP